MTIFRYGKELAEMMMLWDCASERQTVQQLLQAYYILKGNSPVATDFVNTWSDDVLSCAYIAIMDDSRKQKKDIDLLALTPVEP